MFSHILMTFGDQPLKALFDLIDYFDGANYALAK
jgi:hypothetical protein